MNASQVKTAWSGTIVSIQSRSTVWRYRIDNRTHRESGYNVFLNGTIPGGPIHKPVCVKYDFCVSISENQQQKLQLSIGDELSGTGWTPLYPEIEFADLYRTGALRVVKHSPAAAPEVHLAEKWNVTAPHVDSSQYPGPPWIMVPPSLEVYAYRGARLLSKAAWKAKCFSCVWANMAAVTIQYDFDRNLVRNRFETFCYGPLACPCYKMGPARAVPYKGMDTAMDQGWLDEIMVENRISDSE